MGDKVFKIILATLLVGAVGAVLIFGSDSSDTVRPGAEHEDDGAEHISAEESPEYNGGEPPTSGAHARPAPKGVYQEEIPDVNSIHNLEHGYVYVSYQPGLDEETITQLEALFFSPFSNEDFKPSKVIMAPRAANKSPIILSSWQRSQQFESFDEQMLVDYYLSNVNKSPEPTAQ